MVGHRYYNPEWGRWIQPDDIEYLDQESINGLNLYAYCNNDPVNKYDPSGHIAINATLLTILIGTVVGASIGFLSEYIPYVKENIKTDGLQMTDFNVYTKEKRRDLFLSTIGGAFTGLVGSSGINVLIAAPLIGLANTVVGIMTDDVNNFEEGLCYFGMSTIVSFLTLGAARCSTKYKNPTNVRGLPTKFNRLIENVSQSFQKGLYYSGKKADTAVGIIQFIFGLF